MTGYVNYDGRYGSFLPETTCDCTLRMRQGETSGADIGEAAADDADDVNYSSNCEGAHCEGPADDTAPEADGTSGSGA